MAFTRSENSIYRSDKTGQNFDLTSFDLVLSTLLAKIFEIFTAASTQVLDQFFQHACFHQRSFARPKNFHTQRDRFQDSTLETP